MDNTRLVMSETFLSDSQSERKENLQKAVDQYILLQLKNGSLPTGKKSPKCCNADSEQLRLRQEV